MSSTFEYVPQVTPPPIDPRGGEPAFNPVRVLLEETDPLRRSQAHLALGQRAAARDDADTACQHFREAADLDPTDERPRSLLRHLDGGQKRARRGVLGFLTSWRR